MLHNKQCVLFILNQVIIVEKKEICLTPESVSV